MSTTDAESQILAAHCIRALSIDATNRAASGHPGAPMGLADIAVVLWAEVMRFDPACPEWPDRDRFVLSNGHASMLLYAVLHLCGYPLSLEELKNFRQLGSKTPGHPEYGHTAGVETTTGPLGQGFANAVGMALAARMAKVRFNGPRFSPVTHHVFSILGDGCVMEGITAEAASLAGHLGLGELVCVYDDNQITIDGGTDLTMTEDVEKRYQAYGWHTLRIDGHDHRAIKDALLAGKQEEKRPTLILARTQIGYGSPNRAGTSKAHGEPLGDEEARATKEKLGWSHGPFEIPDAAREAFWGAIKRGQADRAQWTAAVDTWQNNAPDQRALWDAHWHRDASLKKVAKEAAGALADKTAATRAMSGQAINHLAAELPYLVGGSADLAGSNKNTIVNSPHVAPDEFSGRNIHFGVREHAMAAMVNGMALYGSFVPFGATFLAFSDYMRPALRLSALMKIRALQIFTHDSIGLGEDGPTHQPVEQLWALRLIPGMTVWRPADGVETAMAWSYAVGEGEEGPHALVFTRQKVAPLARDTDFDPESVWRGAYILKDHPQAQGVIIATGSEVGLAVRASQLLDKEGLMFRVVSMPSVERFLAQDPAYQERVLPPHLKKVSIEAGRALPWMALTGREGLNLGVEDFGQSAPAKEVYAHFGLTPEAVAASIREWLHA